MKMLSPALSNVLLASPTSRRLASSTPTGLQRTSSLVWQISPMDFAFEITAAQWKASCLSRPVFGRYIPAVVAPSVALSRVQRASVDHRTNFFDPPSESLAFITPSTSRVALHPYMQLSTPSFPYHHHSECSGSRARTSLPTRYVIYGLTRPTGLMNRFRNQELGDRAPIYLQTTRVMGLTEEYPVHQRYKHLQLDVSSSWRTGDARLLVGRPGTE